jgi:hypothetical protein
MFDANSNRWPAGFQNCVLPSDLRRRESAGDRHAARSYSLISPPRTQRRRIFVVRSVTAAGGSSAAPGLCRIFLDDGGGVTVVRLQRPG